jgi:hypothetical protein
MDLGDLAIWETLCLSFCIILLHAGVTGRDWLFLIDNV